MSVTDFEALKRWNSIPEEFREKLLNNVFCRKCSTTTIVDYAITSEDGGILLTGSCKTCEGNVARFVEDV